VDDEPDIRHVEAHPESIGADDVVDRQKASPPKRTTPATAWDGEFSATSGPMSFDTCAERYSRKSRTVLVEINR
jgi:hypothetical protein